MSEYELIPDDTYDNLPEGDGDKFVALVRVAQSNLARMLDQQASNEFADEVRSQFVSSIVSIADALGIEGVPDTTEEANDWRKYSLFQAKLAGIVAKARLRGQLIPQQRLKRRRLGDAAALPHPTAGNNLRLIKDRLPVNMFELMRLNGDREPTRT